MDRINRGTGYQQAEMCIQLVNDWNLKQQIRGLVFDTTASNTGLKNGACTLIENSLDKNLVWVACRHHISEIILSSVASVTLGTTSGPENLMFKRFKEKWSILNMTNLIPVDANLCHGKQLELIVYYEKYLQSSFPRDDYKELLELALIFLGGGDRLRISFKKPGALHHARWMAKAIYALKMYLFRDEISLSKAELSGITELALFVALVYCKYWNEAQFAVKAPLNDLFFMSELKSYPNRHIAIPAQKALSRHLWYLGEQLVGLSIFYDRVSNDKKGKMVENMNKISIQNNLKK